MRKALKVFVITFFCAVFLVISATIAVSAWAYYGPRSLNSYIPEIEQSLNAALKGPTAKVRSASLVWGGLQDFVYVRLENVTIRDYTNEKSMAYFKTVDLNFDILKALTGKLVPSKLTISHANVDLTGFFKDTGKSDISLKDFDPSNLGTLVIVNSKLFVPQFTEVWDISKARIRFGKSKIRISADMKPSAGESVSVKGAVRLASGDYRFKGTFVNFKTHRLRAAGIEGTQLIANGTMQALATSGKVRSLEVDFDKLSGSFENKKYLGGKLELKSGVLRGSYDHESGRFSFKDTSLQFADGFALKANGDSETGLTASFVNMKPDNLQNYWPVGMGDNAIDWIKAHISGGMLTSGTAKILGKKVDFNFKYHGINVDYAKPLMPVKNVTGTAHMNEHSLNIKVDSATVGGSKISKTNILISEIGGELEKLTMSGIVTGSVKDLADFYLKVNHNRGKKTLFESQSEVSGAAVSKISMHFPLLAALKFSEVKFGMKADIANASVTKLANDLNVHLNIDDEGYTIKGKGNLNYLGENFKITNAPSLINVDVNGDNMNLDLSADLTRSEIWLAILGAHKPVGETAKLDLKVKNNAIQKLNITSKSFNLAGSGQMDSNQKLKLLDISRFEANGTVLRGQVKNVDGYELNLKSPTLNAVPVVEYLNSDKSEDGENKLKLNLAASEVVFKGGVKSQNVQIEANCDKDCTLLKVTSSDISALKTPTKIAVSSKNAGKAFRMLDLYEFMKGGELGLDANATVPGNYTGVLNINDFYIVKGKVLTKILTLGSLSGIADTLQGNGIHFKKLKGAFKKNDHLITVTDFKMYGAAIGVTAEGTINLVTNKVKLKGSIIPSYTANTLLGKIPLLGDIIIGDEGIFAFAYTLEGDLDDPEISVNPLSVLAPGILKEIFQ